MLSFLENVFMVLKVGVKQAFFIAKYLIFILVYFGVKLDMFS